jgi:hypothetical protein
MWSMSIAWLSGVLNTKLRSLLLRSAICSFRWEIHLICLFFFHQKRLRSSEKISRNKFKKKKRRHQGYGQEADVWELNSSHCSISLFFVCISLCFFFPFLSAVFETNNNVLDCYPREIRFNLSNLFLKSFFFSGSGRDVKTGALKDYKTQLATVWRTLGKRMLKTFAGDVFQLISSPDVRRWY